MTEYFIERAKKIHNDKYNYSCVDYKNRDTNVSIICKIHGQFLQRPVVHLRGSGCKICKNELLSNLRKKPNEEFIEEAKKIHNDKYNYSCVDYQNTKTNVSIICKIHGPFLQKPHNHLAGKGCRICGNNNIKKKLTKNTEKFVKDATIIHGQKYDYSKSNYINNLEEVEDRYPV